MDAEKLAAAWKDESSETIRRLELAKSPTSNPVQYLGYGPIVKGDIKRPYIAPGTGASFTLRWTRLDDDSVRLLLAAVGAWFCMGGIGARSRRGFGSLNCTKAEGNLNSDVLTPTLAALKERISGILQSRTKESTLWSRVGPDAKVYIGPPRKTWIDALGLVGSWMIGFRRRYGSPLDTRKAPKKGPGLDYAWAAPGGQQRREGIPDRVGFGLPLPFGKDGETIVWGDPNHDNRRASPLLIHVSKLSDGTHVPVLTHLPAPLIPANERLVFKRSRNQPDDAHVFERVVQTFLTDLEEKKLIEGVP